MGLKVINSLFLDKPKRMAEHPAVNRRVVGDAIADLRFSESNGGRLKCPNNRYSVAPLLTNPTRGAL